MSNGVFRKLAKQVHPDLNGGSVEATKRMQEVLKFRNNPDMLLALARKWGLRIDGTFDSNAFDQKAEQTRQEQVFDAVVGAIVKHYFHRRNRLYFVRGVIVNIRKIKRGKFSGGREYTVYNFMDRSIVKLKSHRVNPFDSIVGYAHTDQLEDGKEQFRIAKEAKKRQEEYKQARANNQFIWLGLAKNLDYRDLNRQVLINYSYGAVWRDLVRTTPKSVYVDEGGQKPRRISIHKVLRVKKLDDNNNLNSSRRVF